MNGWGAATILAAAGVAVTADGRVPVVWHLLGYPFEAAGMIAALFGCICARLWSMERQRMRKQYRWSLDMPISFLTFAAAIAMVMARRPEPWSGLLIGVGIGVIGEGLFHYAEKFARATGLFGGGDTHKENVP